MEAAKYLTVKQVAKATGISPGLVYTWCRERRLRHLRSGGDGKGKYLIPAADLDAFLAKLVVEEDGDDANDPIVKKYFG
jgi:excisionase family DNA binding protein